VDNGRVKFERLKDSQQHVELLLEEVKELEIRLTTSRDLATQMHWKIQRLEFRVKWAEDAAGKIRLKAERAVASLIAQKLGQQGGNHSPEYGFNPILSKCNTCRGTGGRVICEEECFDIGVDYSEYLPQFHCPTTGQEYWCDDCMGVGNTLSDLEPL
jgi:hypothetical protein